jgi:hypothetical protein
MTGERKQDEKVHTDAEESKIMRFTEEATFGRGKSCPKLLFLFTLS